MIIGLTGSLGTGKTLVASMLKKRGAYVIDADKIVHRILSRAARKKLSEFIFDDARALRKLCSIIHPLVKKEILRDIKDNPSRKIIVIDAPLLIEAGLHKKCHRLVVVKADLATQIRRACKNLGISRSDCIERIRQQMPLPKKVAMADFIIDNRGSLKKTEEQVEELWKKLQPPLGERLQRKERYGKS